MAGECSAAQFPAQVGRSAALAKSCYIGLAKGMGPVELSDHTPMLTSFAPASILAIVTHPVNKWLLCRIDRFGLATLLATTASMLLLGTVVAIAGIALTEEPASTSDALSRRSLEDGGWPALVTHTADRVVDALATRRL